MLEELYDACLVVRQLHPKFGMGDGTVADLIQGVIIV
jgi:hypothetical protein